MNKFNKINNKINNSLCNCNYKYITLEKAGKGLKIKYPIKIKPAYFC
jgi:hypothetical protein